MASDIIQTDPFMNNSILSTSNINNKTLSQTTTNNIKPKSVSSLHREFGASFTPDTTKVSFDNKLYFNTQSEALKYFKYLELMTKRIASYLSNKRIYNLKYAITKWSIILIDYKESDLTSNSHINNWAYHEKECNDNLKRYTQIYPQHITTVGGTFI